MPNSKPILSETDIKHQVIDYLRAKGIFNFGLLQGVGSFKGLPDRVMHYGGKVYYLEIKRPKGILSDHQREFRDQCARDFIDYVVIRSYDEVMAFIQCLDDQK